MPRDDNGVYSLPSGNPVQPGTTIEDAWANSTLQDVAAALTDSLSRTGQGGMQYPLTFGDGNVSAPGIAWTNETGSGFYRAGAADTRLTLQGYGDTARWYNGIGYLRNAADTAWAPIVYQGGVGSTPSGTTNLDTLVWSTATNAWVRQAKNAGGALPVGSGTATALQWNNTTLAWDAVVPAVSGSATVVAGTVTGQTVVWNNSTLRYEATSLVAVSAANSAVAIGSGMTTASGCALSVLAYQWVGNTTGTQGININTYTSPVAGVSLSAGTRSTTLPNASPMAMTVSGSAITFNSVSGITAFQYGGVEAMHIAADGTVSVGGSGSGTARLRIIGVTGDDRLFRVITSTGAEIFTTRDDGIIRMVGLPTSSAGLPSGALWRSSTDIKIVP